MIGYFGRHEGSATSAYGGYNIESLSAYEAYHTRLAADPLGKQNLAQLGKYLSLSYWRDEEAVKGWRNTPEHRHTQSIGRTRTFENYRLRRAGKPPPAHDE